MEWNWILEEYDDMVYVSDLDNYELLYVNRAGLDMFHLSREELFSGKKHLCYEIFHGRNTPCPFCTNKYLKDSGFYEWEHYNEQLLSLIHISFVGKAAVWKREQHRRSNGAFPFTGKAGRFSSAAGTAPAQRS